MLTNRHKELIIEEVDSYFKDSKYNYQKNYNFVKVKSSLDQLHKIYKKDDEGFFHCIICEEPESDYVLFFSISTSYGFPCASYRHCKRNEIVITSDDQEFLDSM